MAEIHAHVVVHMKAARFECLHCGQTFGLSLPMKVASFFSLGEKFEAMHAKCQPPAKEATA